MRMRDTVFIALLAAILCIFSPLSFPIGPLPVSLGLFGVCLISLLTDKRHALMAILLYVALGAVGMPVFAGFSGGAHVLSGPTGGYLFGYVPMAAVICSFYGKKRTVWRMVCGMLLGLFMCYILGVLWYAMTADVSFLAAICVGVLPFLPFDAVKLVAAGALAIVLGRRVDKIMNFEGGQNDR